MKFQLFVDSGHPESTAVELLMAAFVCRHPEVKAKTHNIRTLHGELVAQKRCVNDTPTLIVEEIDEMPNRNGDRVYGTMTAVGLWPLSSWLAMTDNMMRRQLQIPFPEPPPKALTASELRSWISKLKKHQSKVVRNEIELRLLDLEGITKED
jgi:hypothetical protein